MMNDPIRPESAGVKVGQPYVDEPVYVEPKRIGEMEYVVGRCFNSAREMAERQKPRIQVAWQKVWLNWR